jgi:hypothetical protein
MILEYQNNPSLIQEEKYTGHPRNIWVAQTGINRFLMTYFTPCNYSREVPKQI